MPAVRCPAEMLPEVGVSAAEYGLSLGLAVRRRRPDSRDGGRSAGGTIGQDCTEPGNTKCTFGTGAFLLMNVGREAEAVDGAGWHHRRLDPGGGRGAHDRGYALEGSAFIAGALVQWLRDGLGIIEQAADVNALAAKADPAERRVPGAGLRRARRAALGCRRPAARFTASRATPAPPRSPMRLWNRWAYQTRELLEAMRADWPRRQPSTVLRVDGGMTGSDLDHAVPRRYSGRPGRSPGIPRDDRAGRGLSGRLQGRGLPGSARFCKDLGARAALRTAPFRGRSPAEMGWAGKTLFGAPERRRKSLIKDVQKVRHLSRQDSAVRNPAMLCLVV